MSDIRSQTLPDSAFRDLIEESPIPTLWVDRQGRIVTTNFSFQNLSSNLAANRVDSWKQDSVEDLFPSLHPGQWGMLWQILEDQRFTTTREVFGESLETGRTMELSLQKVFSGEEAIVAIYLQDVDVSHRVEGIQILQHEILEAVAMGRPFRLVVDLLCQRVEALAPEVICTVLLVDREGKIRPLAGPSMPEQFSRAIDGIPIGPKVGSCGTAAWRGEAVEVTDIAHDPLWDDYREIALPLGLAACWSTPITLRDGRVAGTFALYYHEPRGSSIFHRQMVRACVHLCCLAIEHEESERQIHQLAFYDPLTGLANRTLLRERAQQALVRVQRERFPLAVMFLDLDRFKTINDTMGHNTGDRLLKTIAQRLQHCLKPTDTIARLGGDEFVLLLQDTGMAQASHVAERLLAAVTERVAINSTELTPTASIGISIAPDDSTDFEILQRNADVAMYQAKSAGRNTYRFFQQQMNEVLNERLALETALHRALVDNEFLVYFQPQIHLPSQTLYGLEALVRWQHPKWGMVSPANFIPVAEDCGLIGSIDHWVMGEVCRQLSSWRRQGFNVKTVAVNLSPADFHYTDVPDRVRSLLQQYNLQPGSLTLEITESLLLNTIDETLETLQNLRDIGVGLAVDDFGTGYSSLSYLKRFPVNELKLDQSFVRDLANDPGDRALANAIIHLGSIFNHTVVAEGVETPDQLDFLIEQKCAVAQGYFFARPMSAENMTLWMQTEGSRYL